MSGARALVWVVAHSNLANPEDALRPEWFQRYPWAEHVLRQVREHAHCSAEALLRGTPACPGVGRI
eukprot:5121206-Alexandrium_andersonii.AAC.1